MLENNLKELGNMLVKAGNTIKKQKEKIELLQQANRRLTNEKRIVEFENKMLKEKNKNISMDAFKFSFVGDFNVLIYDPIMKKSAFFEDGNTLYMKNLSEYENREIVAVGVYKDCEDVPFLAITLND
jgi:hypothetical protein